jgi:hypothetical protein
MRSRCAPTDDVETNLSPENRPTASVACDLLEEDVRFDLFDSRDSMNAAFGARAQEFGVFSGDCRVDGTAQNAYSVRGQEVGRVLCRRTRETSEIVWTDERVLVAADAIRDDQGDAALYAWWLSAAGPQVEGDVAKDVDPAATPLPSPPTGTYLAVVDERAAERIQRSVGHATFSWVGTFGIHLSDGRYHLSYYGRFSPAETGTYVMTKEGLLVLTARCDATVTGSSDYRWTTLADGSVIWTLVRSTGDVARGVDACVPGPWPLTSLRWSPAPLGDIVYSVQGQLVRDRLATWTYTTLRNEPNVSSREPAWSPDGNRIAFVSNEHGGDDIYVMNANGSHVVRITDDPGDEHDPAWSPDGTRIAYHRELPGAESAPSWLSIVDLSTMERTDLYTRVGYVGRGAWSPDGSRLAFEVWPEGSGPDTYVVDADGGHAVRIASTPGLLDARPMWTPDGSRLVFQRLRRDGGLELVSARPDGSDPERLLDLTPLAPDASTSGGVVTSFSPDGKWIMIAHPAEAPGPLSIQELATGRTFALEPSASEASWRPSPF